MINLITNTVKVGLQDWSCMSYVKKRVFLSNMKIVGVF